MLNDFREQLQSIESPLRKPIVKHGTIAIGVVETTPVVWEGRLLRFEWVRNHGWEKRTPSRVMSAVTALSIWKPTDRWVQNLLMTTPLAAVMPRTA